MAVVKVIAHKSSNDLPYVHNYNPLLNTDQVIMARARYIYLCNSQHEHLDHQSKLKFTQNDSKKYKNSKFKTAQQATTN